LPSPPVFKPQEEELRSNFLKYTRIAFQAFSLKSTPRILDIGCGTGVPTLELAKLTKGQIIALDIDESALKELNRKIEIAGLSYRIKTQLGSLYELEFPPNSFDIIWAEGVTSIISVETALKTWYAVLKPQAYLVMHVDAQNLAFDFEMISNQLGYEVVETFLLPEDAWWKGYYSPLEKQIQSYLELHSNNKLALESVKTYLKTIKQVKKNPSRYRSGFIIFKRI